MARWTASAKWAAGRALDGQRDMPLALRLSEGLGGSLRGDDMHGLRRIRVKLRQVTDYLSILESMMRD